jgi:hypothetical protein
LLSWALPLIVWLINLWDQKQGNLTAVPGHTASAVGLAAGSALIAVLGLTMLSQDLRGLRTRLVRLPGRLFVLGTLTCLWPISTALQQPYFLGACYTAPIQTEAQTQFSAIQSVGADQHGNLYVLDSYGLRERTPDDRFHLLLDFAEPAQTPSPFYSSTIYTQMSVSPDGLVALGNPNATTVYRVLGPGRMTVAARAPYLHGGMALGRDGTLYLSSANEGRIDVYTPNHPDQPTILHPHPLPADWQPEALSLDFQGNLYVVDLGSQAIEQISPNGQLRKVAWMTTNGVTALTPASLTQVTSSYGPASSLYVSIAGSPSLIYLPQKRIGVRQPVDGGMSAAQTGGSVYVASGYYLAAFQGIPGTSPTASIGGAATPSQVCKANL